MLIGEIKLFLHIDLLADYVGVSFSSKRHVKFIECNM